LKLDEMKPYRDLYPRVWAWENLEEAYRKARKGKRGPLATALERSARAGVAPTLYLQVSSPTHFGLR